MKIGYIRTSTGEQTGAAQRQALTDHGCDRIFHDKGISGGAVIKPQLNAALADARSGDTFVVTGYNRLARSLLFLIEDVKRIHEAGMEFVSLREQIDTTTPTGRLYFYMVGAFAEFERDMIRQRTRDGMAAARSRGVKPGRKPAITDERWEDLRPMLELHHRALLGSAFWRIASQRSGLENRHSSYRSCQRHRWRHHRNPKSAYSPSWDRRAGEPTALYRPRRQPIPLRPGCRQLSL